ncbi:hypothetical protein HIM_05542 [Hirsutella minnesotensis 3608]|uniref:Zn(2)-C6 fungal-type domain-containing protein n=1 Tax=Hirsutella minnesotensis 3608 TaxID=1043627 RepID=A0A0F7ZK87_9HYPO|nr:hypothetical protein HIM_05542 [Hirsutella minnesotensis 3608]
MDMQLVAAGMLPLPDLDHESLPQWEGIDWDEANASEIISPTSADKTTPSSSDSKSTADGGSSLDAVVRRQPAHRQRLERRGHTKSRRGCYNCKRRRIKCQETRPACGHCVKTGLTCEYPAQPTITHQPHDQIPLFTMQDMRFFQHFLTQCYPHHPLRQEEVWTHEIPCIAHNASLQSSDAYIKRCSADTGQHEFLMHSILGFAASELSRTEGDRSLVTAAMAHRVKAIKAIKKRLAEASKADMTHEEANALVATCFALTFQSISLDDGLAEYMTFIRGILIVGIQMMCRGIAPVFSSIFEDRQMELVAPLMRDLPLIQRAWVEAAVEGIAKLRPLCVDAIEVEYQEQLIGIAQRLLTNSFDGKLNRDPALGMTFYGWWMMMPHASFQELINLDRQTILLLHTHWISLALIMAPISECEFDLREKHPSQPDKSMDPGFIRWLKHLNARVDGEHQQYNQWPLWVDAQLDRDISIFGKRR